jgi:hypothetical protein
VKTPVAETPGLMLSLARHFKRKKSYAMAAYVDTREISDTSKHSIDNHNLEYYAPSPKENHLRGGDPVKKNAFKK